MQVDEIVLASRVCNLFGGIPQAWQRTTRPSANAVQHMWHTTQHHVPAGIENPGSFPTIVRSGLHLPPLSALSLESVPHRTDPLTP